MAQGLLAWVWLVGGREKGKSSAARNRIGGNFQKATPDCCVGLDLDLDRGAGAESRSRAASARQWAVSGWGVGRVGLGKQ